MRRKTVKRPVAARAVAAPERRLTYDEFRTGLTFKTVRQMLWVHSPDPRDWKYKRRRTVLGMWWQLKQQMYARYLDELDGGGLSGGR